MKRKIAAILAAFAFMITGAVVSAPTAQAETNLCFFGWDGPDTYWSGGNKFIKGTASVGCRSDIYTWHSVLVALKRKAVSTGSWVTVDGSSSGWVDARTNNGPVVLSTFPELCWGSAQYNYRVEVSHRLDFGSVHYHQGPTVTHNCTAS